MSWIYAIWERFFPLVVPEYASEQQGGRKADEESSEDRVVSSLAKEQRVLADDLERVFKIYDHQLQETSLQLRSLRQTQDRVKAEKVKSSQSRLKTALQRLEASVKDDERLAEELKHWQDRAMRRKSPNKEIGQRLEIVRSELLLRGKTPFVPPLMQEIVHEVLVQEEAVEVKSAPSVARERMAAPGVDLELGRRHESPKILPETEHLLAAAREAARETNRWHAIPAHMHNEDALLQVHHLKDLNAKLKQMDKQKGITRYRLDLAPLMSEV